MNEHEFLGLYNRYAAALFRHCYLRVSERERAKDIVQETFTRTWGYITRGNRLDSPKAFLYRVANNIIVDESRKKKPASLDALHEEGFDPPAERSEITSSIAEAHEVLRFLDCLEESQRQVFVMRYIDDLGPKEIAAITGESENTISVRLHRAVAKLRVLMSGHAYGS